MRKITLTVFAMLVAIAQPLYAHTPSIEASALFIRGGYQEDGGVTAKVLRQGEKGVCFVDVTGNSYCCRAIRPQGKVPSFNRAPDCSIAGKAARS